MAVAGKLPASRRALAAALLLASGFSSLALQVLWVQQSSLWLGQESAAVLAVVAAFFGGLAAGSWVTAPLESRAYPPTRLYAASELLVAAWALALVFLLQPVSGLLAGLVPAAASPLSQWAVAFGGTFLLLLPGTVAMGATLPLMERCLGNRHEEPAFGLLYAANTGGAVLGALGAAFLFIPQLGLGGTAMVCAGVNLLCAAGAFALPAPAPKTTPAGTHAPLWTQPVGRLFFSGLLGIGFELLLVRALCQWLQNTVYTFAILVAVYLAGTTVGAALHRRFRGRLNEDSAAATFFCCTALAVAGSLPLLAEAPALQGWLATHLPASVAGALVAEATLAFLAFFPATVAMGLAFTQLIADAGQRGVATGNSLTANLLGGSLAAPLLGAWLLPALGLHTALIIVTMGYLALAFRSRWVWPAGAAVALLLVLSPAPALVTLPQGAQVLASTEGRLGTVTVLEAADGTRTLHIDNRQQEGSNRTTYADARQALLPLLLHPSPQHALFLGVGTGMTASAATLVPGVEVEAVELVPEVIAAGRWFAEGLPAGTDPARLHVIAADARRYVRATDNRYDVIVADNFHPARSGTGSMYSREHFQAVRARLQPDGVFCQWLPLHQLDLVSVASVVHAYVEVFPDAVAILATNSLDTPTLGLIARRDGKLPGLANIAERLKALPESVREQYDVPDEWAVAGTIVGGAPSLRALAGQIPANTDDRPFVAYHAPFATYAPEALPRDRLLRLVDVLEPMPQETLSTVPTAASEQRLARYWQARDAYLHAGRNIRPVAGVKAMLAQVEAPLLGVLRLSADFQPAYRPLMGMAQALAVEDPVAGDALRAAIAAAMEQGKTATP